MVNNLKKLHTILDIQRASKVYWNKFSEVSFLKVIIKVLDLYTIKMDNLLWTDMVIWPGLIKKVIKILYELHKVPLWDNLALCITNDTVISQCILLRR